MPFSSNEELPKSVRDTLPSDAKSVFRSVANKELSQGSSEESAFAQAWTAVKNGWEKKNDRWVRKMDELVKVENIAKLDDSLGLVFGWAIVCKVDGEDYYDLNVDRNTMERVPEHIPEDCMMKAAMEFMETSRPGNEMHNGPDSGTYLFAWPMTTEIAKAMNIQTEKTGLMVAYKPTPEVYKKFADGTYKGFSIEGSRIRSHEVQDD